MPSQPGPSRRTVLTALGAASLAGTFAAPASAAERSGAAAVDVDLPAAAGRARAP